MSYFNYFPYSLMKNFTFPQETTVPKHIKQKVMAYVHNDMGHRPQVLKRSRLIKTMIPNFVVLILAISVFSVLNFTQTPESASINSGLVSSTSSTTPFLSDPTDTIQKTLVETETLLQDLSNMGEEV